MKKLTIPIIIWMLIFEFFSTFAICIAYCVDNNTYAISSFVSYPKFMLPALNLFYYGNAHQNLKLLEHMRSFNCAIILNFAVLFIIRQLVLWKVKYELKIKLFGYLIIIYILLFFEFFVGFTISKSSHTTGIEYGGSIGMFFFSFMMPIANGACIYATRKF